MAFEAINRHTTPFYQYGNGAAYLGNSLNLLTYLDTASIDLICTSPPFALLRQKQYGNVTANEYVEWFMQFAHEFRRVLKLHDSLVLCGQCFAHIGYW